MTDEQCVSTSAVLNLHHTVIPQKGCVCVCLGWRVEVCHLVYSRTRKVLVVHEPYTPALQAVPKPPSSLVEEQQSSPHCPPRDLTTHTHTQHGLAFSFFRCLCVCVYTQVHKRAVVCARQSIQPKGLRVKQASCQHTAV